MIVPRNNYHHNWIEAGRMRWPTYSFYNGGFCPPIVYREEIIQNSFRGCQYSYVVLPALAKKSKYDVSFGKVKHG
jgi:hypothetical protein